MDAWITATPSVENPANIYCAVSGLLRPNMVLSVTDTSATDPLDWSIHFIQRYTIPSGFTDLLAYQRDQQLRQFADRQAALDLLVSIRQRALRQKRPEIDAFSGLLQGAKIVGDRIVLPEKTSRPARWCITFAQIRYVLPVPLSPPDLDDACIVILQLVREGFTAKEIGSRAGLSHRTVEHKLEKLKNEFGARSMAHLATLSLGALKDRVT